MLSWSCPPREGSEEEPPGDDLLWPKEVIITLVKLQVHVYWKQWWGPGGGLSGPGYFEVLESSIVLVLYVIWWNIHAYSPSSLLQYCQDFHRVFYEGRTSPIVGFQSSTHQMQQKTFSVQYSLVASILQDKAHLFACSRYCHLSEAPATVQSLRLCKFHSLPPKHCELPNPVKTTILYYEGTHSIT